MQNIENLLENNENIIWRGVPQFKPFVFPALISLPFGLVFAGFGVFPILAAFKTEQYWMLLFPHFWIGLLLGFGPFIYKLLVYKHTDYAVTNKRVIFKSGVIGRDYSFIDFDKITNSEVNVGVFDVVLGNNSGTINIFSAGTLMATKSGIQSIPYKFSSITDPYNAIKLLKKVSFDIKTDINYPNELRPKENSGYNTEYGV